MAFPSEALLARLDAVAAHPEVSGAVIADLRAFLEREPPAMSHRIAPRAYARRRGLPDEAVIDTFLLATKAGLLELELLTRCDACGGFGQAGAAWNQLSVATGHCYACDAATEVRLDDSVEVVFSLDSSLREQPLDPYADLQAYLAHVFSRSFEHSAPATACLQEATRGIALLPPGGSSTTVLEGRSGQQFRLVSVDAHLGVPLTVREGGKTTVEVQLGDDDKDWPPLVIAPGPVSLVLRNLRSSGVGLFVMMDDVRAAMRAITATSPPIVHPFLSGRDLLNQQRFRELFRYQGLDPSLRLRLGSLTLLFTDLKGSTALYEATGDITAYSVVRDHFEVLLDAVRAHRGAVVKTMGDAVMASFSNPVDATRAALSMLRGMTLVTDRVGQLGQHTGLKVGIHEGTALAVANDDRLDFFGQTVNIAARVQALADADEVCVTARVMQEPEVAALFHAYGYTGTRSEVELKGVGGRTEVFRFALM